MSEENNNAMMLMMAKSLLDVEEIPKLDTIFKKIDAISSSDLMELANIGLNINKMSSLTFLPH